MSLKPADLDALRDRLGDQEWRLNNLYFVTDEKGAKVQFVMNDAQRQLYETAWYRNIVLKARQLGFTTFIQIFMLDSILFTPNLRCGVIAQGLNEAQTIFRDKVLYAYDNLPEWLFLPEVKKHGLEIPTAVKRDAGELLLSNNSSIRVGTSMRSGTVQILHVSEYGKICRKYPDKAKEIKTGAFPAVHEGSWIFVESTAEGRDGHFFTMCQESQKEMQRIHAGSRGPLNPMEFKFNFFAWWGDSRYRTDPSTVELTPRMIKYFAQLKLKHGIELDAEQMAWYARREADLGEDMKQEYPSTPEEAFEVSIEGAYYAEQLTQLRHLGRIGEVPWEPSVPVNVFWDLGMNDEMSLWFHQRVGREHRLIDYYANSGEGFDHYAAVLREKGYHYGKHYMPHDIGVRELGAEGGRTRQRSAELLGIKPIKPIPRPKNLDQVLAQIDMVRAFLLSCWIDATTCAEGLKALENYRKEWDEKLGTWKKGPLHNWASHGADALRTGASGWKDDTTYTDADTLPEAVETY